MDSLPSGFLRSATRHPDRPALHVDGREWTYAELDRVARRLAAAIGVGADPGTTGILARRTVTACAGVLAALIAGDAYVPLNPTFPASRLGALLERSGCRAVIVDAEGRAVLDDLLGHVDRQVAWILPDADPSDVAGLRAAWPAQTFVGAGDLPGPLSDVPSRPMESAAYLLFTSGSTGEPKGVPVPHRCIRRFLDVVVERFDLQPTDRFSHTFELAFDLSLFDLFAAWEVGGCVCVASDADLLQPARYLLDRRITVWFSVPSLGLVMDRFRALAPGFYPELRWVLFCGEALPAAVAVAFASAAPNAGVENLYGPTEVTLACTGWRLPPGWTGADAVHGNVPIGTAFPGLTALVVDAELRPLPDGEPGELLMAGPQVVDGYLNDPVRTDAAFVRPPGSADLHYRTGDRVVRQPDGALAFLGRVDFQVKIRGYRVEPGEIEAVARELADVPAVVALPWAPRGGAPDTLVLVVDRPVPEGLIAAMAERLPAYMVPREVRTVDAFPLNPNGKIDRRALAARVLGG